MIKKLGLTCVILLSLAVFPVWAEDDTIGRVFTESPITSLNSGWIPASLKVSPDSNTIGYIIKEQGSKIAVINGIRNHKYQDIQDDILFFSPNSQHVAYVAQQGSTVFLVVDGIERQGYQDIKKKSFTFSEDGRHLAYIAKVNNKWLVVRDSAQGEPFDDIGTSTLKLSSDGSHLFYAAQKDGQWLLVADGKPGKAYDGIRSIACDSDGKRVAAVVRIDSQFAVVVNGITSRSYEMIRANSLKFSADGSRLAYIADSQGKQLVVVDDKVGKEYEQIGSGGVVFSRDGNRYGYTAKVGDGWAVIVDDQESPWYNGVMENGPLFSPNGKKVAYVAKSGEKWFVVKNGAASPFYDAIGDGTLTFSPDSRRLAYVAKKQSKWVVAVDGEEGRLYDDIGRESLTFSPGGRHLVYSARRGEHWFVVLNGTEGRSYTNVITGFGGGIIFEGYSGFKYQALQGWAVLGVNERLLEKESAKEYTFRFNPASGTRFVVTQRMTGTVEVDKLAQTNFIFEQLLKTEYIMTKNKEGFNIQVRFISLDQKSNGKDINVELSSLLKDAYLTIITDPNGHYLRMDGIDSYYQKMEAALPKEILRENPDFFSKSSLEERFKYSWEESVGRFLGRSFKLGDSWTVEDGIMLPNQERLKFTSTVKFTDEVRQDHLQWVRMKVEGVFDNKAIEKFLNEMGKTVDNTKLNAKFNLLMTGEGLMDPETMLQHSGNVTVAMNMAMDTPQGRVNAVVKMRMETEVEYQSL